MNKKDKKELLFTLPLVTLLFGILMSYTLLLMNLDNPYIHLVFLFITIVSFIIFVVEGIYTIYKHIKANMNKDEKNKWLIYLLFLNLFTIPYYYSKYILKNEKDLNKKYKLYLIVEGSLYILSLIAMFIYSK